MKLSNASMSGWRLFVLASFLLLCWGLAIRHLSAEWTLDEQYNYGWIVPLLALYLFRLRLENIPERGPVRWPWVVPTGFLLVALGQALLLPICEANADWRLLGWVLTGLAAAATLLAFWQAGGLAFALHFSFPVLFFFTSVPWPRSIETEVMQWLMQYNARLAAEFLHWLGVMAEVRGNVIQLTSATVGIDEACSGIRSLQGALMATLFVGDIFELKWSRRLILLIAGAVWALVTNSVRTFFLSLMTELGGMEAHDRWHDTAGYWILGTCVSGVILTGWLLSSKRVQSKTILIRHEPIILTERLAGSGFAALAGSFIIFAAWGATEIWFQSREASVIRLTGWIFKQPTDAAHFESVEQSELVRNSLRYDFHSGGRWRDVEGRNWVAHFFRWDPGANDMLKFYSHDPRTCLVASGKQFLRTLPDLTHQIGDSALPFNVYHFRERVQDVFVFNCAIEDVRRSPGQEADAALALTTSSRFNAVWNGRRNHGQRRLEVAIWGARDDTAARKAFEELLRRQIEVQDIPITHDD